LGLSDFEDVFEKRCESGGRGPNELRGVWFASKNNEKVEASGKTGDLEIRK
jgi:hypothetical protein